MDPEAPPRAPGKSRKSLELVRGLYQRMKLWTTVYRTLAIVAVLAAAGLGIRLAVVNRRMATMRRQAADVFYQMKALELEVGRLAGAAPERAEIRERRAGLEATYADWTRRLEERRTAPADEHAIRAAIARLGEMPLLASEEFVRDVRARIGEWRATPDYARAMREARSAGIPALVESVLVDANLPRDLEWLAFQESRFSPRAVGPETRFGIAKGMWQLMPATARQYGLRIGPLVGEARFDPNDQRHDLRRSTRAAVRYAGDLYQLDAQGSGLLVMACYNAGQTRVLALLRSLPARPSERNFWRLLERYRAQVPDETYGYVVGIVAAAAVAAEPEVFGFVRS